MNLHEGPKKISLVTFNLIFEEWLGDGPDKERGGKQKKFEGTKVSKKIEADM